MKHVVIEPPVFWQFSAVRTALLQTQSGAHALSESAHMVWKHAHVAPPSRFVTVVFPAIGVHGAAASSLASSPEPVSTPASTPGAALLLDELHPISNAPAPTIEAAAKPIKYRDARIS